MTTWLVILQGHDRGQLYGEPRFIEAADADEALLLAWGQPPSTHQVAQAMVVPVAGPWQVYPAQVPAPHWGNGTTYGT